MIPTKMYVFYLEKNKSSEKMPNRWADESVRNRELLIIFFFFREFLVKKFQKILNQIHA